MFEYSLMLDEVLKFELSRMIISISTKKLIGHKRSIAHTQRYRRDGE